MGGKKYTDEQKDEFFRLLDKGGTVRAAARAAGVHEDAGYKWLRKTGLTMKRAAPRTYPTELKEEFLRLVREKQIISTVAVELGVHRPTAYAWARKAGIFTSDARRVNPRGQDFLRLRAEGLTRAQVPNQALHPPTEGVEEQAECARLLPLPRDAGREVRAGQQALGRRVRLRLVLPRSPTTRSVRHE